MMCGASGDECGNYLLWVRTQYIQEVIDPGGRSVERPRESYFNLLTFKCDVEMWNLKSTL
jgi:hypothetical protein